MARSMGSCGCMCTDAEFPWHYLCTYCVVSEHNVYSIVTTIQCRSINSWKKSFMVFVCTAGEIFCVILPCAQYAQRVTYSSCICVCVCVCVLCVCVVCVCVCVRVCVCVCVRVCV